MSDREMIPQISDRQKVLTPHMTCILYPGHVHVEMSPGRATFYHLVTHIIEGS